jgi:hypothetical protein
MIYSMFAVFMLVFLVGCFAVRARFASVKKGDLSVRYFKLMSAEGSAHVPDVVTKTTRCFNNQFEIPVLFYVVATLYIVTGTTSDIALIFAWIFVVARYVHAFIHLTYNAILHRMLSFWLGFVCVFVLWVNLLLMLS